MSLKKIQSALISVYYKDGLEPIIRLLHQQGVTLYSTGGTQSFIEELGIPVIAVVDTNHSPEGVDYIIPGNDDSSKAVLLYARGIADAILEGKANSVQEILTAVKEGEEEFVEEGKAE